MTFVPETRFSHSLKLFHFIIPYITPIQQEVVTENRLLPPIFCPIDIE